MGWVMGYELWLITLNKKTLAIPYKTSLFKSSHKNDV
jgi:hypothetical protein